MISFCTKTVIHFNMRPDGIKMCIGNKTYPVYYPLLVKIKLVYTDSRRKVQPGFYKILRDNENLEVNSLKDLQEGDVFDMHSFKVPGVYVEVFKTKKVNFIT